MIQGLELKVKIARDVPVATYPFTEYFKGFDKTKAVRRIFGNKTEEALRNLKVEFAMTRGYMSVSDIDGHILISARYLKEGDMTDIYLDIIHELVHVKQFMEGKELFDDNFTYTKRPTELEAYRHTVEEARRMGLDDKRICQYLCTEWMSKSEIRRLAKALKVECHHLQDSGE